MDIEHIMPRRQAGPQPTWTDVKAKLASFDRLAFLHARFELGKDVLKPYKETLQRWLSPDVLRNQDPSVVKAKQAISGYTKAVGEPAGLAELMVFYCERAAGFCNDVGYHETSYSNSLVRMFQEALKIISKLSDSDRKPLISRLDEVRATNHLGYWVGDTMDDLLAEYVGCEPLLVGQSQIFPKNFPFILRRLAADLRGRSKRPVIVKSDRGLRPPLKLLRFSCRPASVALRWF